MARELEAPATPAWLAVLAVLALLAAGCGSTVGPADLGTTGQGVAGVGAAAQDNAGMAAGGAAPGSSGSAGAVTGPGAGGVTSGSGQSSAAAPAGGAGSLGGAGAAPAVSGASNGPGAAGAPTSGPVAGPTEDTSAPAAEGRGYTAEEILIGFGTSDDASAVGSAFGFELSFGDARAQVDAVVEDINARGGVLGRQVVPVFHDVSSAQMVSDKNVAAQAACAAWTEDTPVFAVASVNAGLHSENFFGCLEDAGTGLVFGDLTPTTDAFFDYGNPVRYADGMITVERLVEVLIDRLIALDYFSPWDTTAGAPGVAPVKIGFVYADNTVGRRWAEALEAALGRRDMRLDSTFMFSADAGTAFSQVPSAGLQFRSEGVTHLLDTNNVAVLGPAFEEQQYRPRWGLTSAGSLAVVTQGAVPASQLNGALGVGWVPATDVDQARDPGDSPALARCRQLMEDAGQDTSNKLTMAVMAFVCDEFGLLASALNAGGELSLPGLARGVEGVGAQFESAVTFRSLFAPSQARLTGAAAVRDIAYLSDCSCFSYLDAVDRPA